MIENYLRQCFNEREGHIFFIISPTHPYELVLGFAGCIFVKKVGESAKICSEQVYKKDSSFQISHLKSDKLVTKPNQNGHKIPYYIATDLI